MEEKVKVKINGILCFIALVLYVLAAIWGIATAIYRKEYVFVVIVAFLAGLAFPMAKKFIEGLKGEK